MWFGVVWNVDRHRRFFASGRRYKGGWWNIRRSDNTLQRKFIEVHGNS